MPDFNKISPTARGTLYALTFCDVPYAKELLQKAHALDNLAQFAKQVGMNSNPDSWLNKKILALFSPNVELRFKSTLAILKQRGIKNILEIAAGLSPMGLVMTEDPEVKYIETDLPEILEQKKAAVNAILDEKGIERPNLKLAPANALNFEELWSAIKDLPGPVAVINQGLLRYLTDDEKFKVAQNVRKILAEKGGVWVSPDFEPLKGRHWLLNYVHTRLTRRITERDTRRNAFQNEKDLEKFLNASRFDFQAIPQMELVAGELASAKNLNISQRKIKKRCSGLMNYILTPWKL